MLEPSLRPSDLSSEPVPSEYPDSTSSVQVTPKPGPSRQITNLPGYASQGREERVDPYPLWSPVELTFTGPQSSGVEGQDNPFKITLDVQFVSPGGSLHTVPGFYNGDGHGGLAGNIWKVIFTPDEIGEWNYSSMSPQILLDGHNGTFQVIPQLGCEAYQAGGLPNFECQGRLIYSGEHYLKFMDGTYWVKGGVNEPEDFLAPGVTAGFASKEQAVDYLAGQGLNSIYILLHNIDGDKQNVWPWLGSSQGEAKQHNEYFDVDKLGEWERIFYYIQARGIVLHLVLEDDSAWTGFNRQMYYREMVARFAHYNGLIWNIAEEFDENYSAQEISQFARMLRDLDPYDHPITVHHSGSTERWEAFLNDENLDLTSFQTRSEPQNDQAVYWFDLVDASQKTIPISFDETGQLELDQRDLARHIVWSVFLGGANFELFPQLVSGYPEFEPHFGDLVRARSFIEQMSFETMSPCNDLLQFGAGYCFGQREGDYVIYFPHGGSWAVDLSGFVGVWEGSWFDPRTGELLPTEEMDGGEVQSLSTPSREDWVLWIANR